MKICGACKIPKDLSEFHKRGSGYKPKCKTCRNKLKRDYNRNNADKICKYSESRKEIAKKYLKEYNKIYYPKNRVCISEYKKEWRKNNLDKHAATERKRRALKAGVNENYTIEDAKITMKKFNYEYFNCLCKENLHIDHNKPLSKGYPLTIDNAVVLCNRCNTSKGAKNPEDFYSKSKFERLVKILGD